MAQFGRLPLGSSVAWWPLGIARIDFLIGFRNRAVVAVNWAWNDLTFQRGTRLVTGPDPEVQGGGALEPAIVRLGDAA